VPSKEETLERLLQNARMEIGVLTAQAMSLQKRISKMQEEQDEFDRRLIAKVENMAKSDSGNVRLWARSLKRELKKAGVL
jgi:hypothetical protein